MNYQSVHIIVLALGLYMSFVEVDGACEMGFTPVGDNCFWFGFESKTFKEAEQSCKIMGSHLASCLTEPEVSYLKNYVKHSYDRFHIGNTLQNEKNEVTNADGTSLTAKIEFELDKFPNYDIARCIILDYSGKMKNYHCISPAYYICKSGPTSCGPKYICPEGWYRNMNQCYLAVHRSATFTAAAQDCTSMKAYLPAPTTDYDWRVIQLVIGVNWPYYPMPIWLGKVKDGQWDTTDSRIAGEQSHWCNGNGAPENATGVVFAQEVNYRVCFDVCKDCTDQRNVYMCVKNFPF